MRITSGNYKGKTINTPGLAGTHPMGERERLALFNMVGNDLTGANVLDAYAGSGALGMEALSRWAPLVFFVEKEPKAIQTIRKNIDRMELYGFPNPPTVKIICSKVGNFETDYRFRLILADPPYDNFDLTDVSHLVKFLCEDGTFALSHPGEAPEIPGLELLKSRSYAGATISIYRKNP